MAIRNVRRLQEEFDKTERPDFRLRRDLADARAYLEAVKAKDKVKRKTNRAERIRAQLVEAEEEANRAFEVATETSRAAEKTKKAANASRQDLKSLREKHASTSILEAAELREEEDGWTFRNEEDAHVVAEKQLYEANGQV